MTGRTHLRTVTTIEEVEHFQQLERLIWQSPAEDVVPVHVAITVIRNGGGIIAAFADDGPKATGGMVGLTFWFPGLGVPTTGGRVSTGGRRGDEEMHSVTQSSNLPSPDLPLSPAPPLPLREMCSHLGGGVPGWAIGEWACSASRVRSRSPSSAAERLRSCWASTAMERGWKSTWANSSTIASRPGGGTLIGPGSRASAASRARASWGWLRLPRPLSSMWRWMKLPLLG